MSTSYVTTSRSDLLTARRNLSRFVCDQAHRAARDVRFGWVGSADAPATYQDLQAAFEHSTRTGAPLPVSTLYCEDTIFMEPSDNVAFRFWHDTSHCRHRLNFTLPDEWQLTMWHLDQLQDAGFGPGSHEYELLWLDLFGQIILLGVADRFPINQGEFTRTCAERGLDRGVLAELGRVA